MGLLNNLRQRIVHRLIRPDDGYIHTGYPTRLYSSSTGQYIMCRSTPIRAVYHKPTLAGWREINISGEQVQDVEFTEWIFGIISNLSAEYSNRLDNITPKELKKLNKKEGKIVINKQSFCDIMHALDNYWDNLRGLQGILDVIFEDNMLTQVFDRVVEALTDDLEPDLEYGEDPMIIRWLFEFDAGRDEKAHEGIDGYSLTSAEELYDYLMHKKSLQETLDKFENM